MIKKSKDKLSFVFKKTNELNDQQINQINNLFNLTFQQQLKKPRDKEQFKFKYLKNFMNFSFHGLMINENHEIVGCYNVIPYEFIFFSKKKIFGQSVDTTIHADYKGNIYNLKKLANIVYENLQKAGVSVVYGLANKKFYLVKKKILGWSDIGKLNYYVLPINVKKFYKIFYFINNLFFIFIKLLIKFKIKKKEKYNFNISKIYNENFHSGRYDKNYQVLEEGECKIIFKEINHKKYDNAKIVYIIDVIPLSKINIELSVNKILKALPSTDLIIYVGNLRSVPANLLKVPKFLLKKKQTIISGKILNSAEVDNSIFKISNWSINLSNFDII